MKKLIFSMLSLSLVAAISGSCSKVTYTSSSQEARVYEPFITTPLTRPLTADVEVLSDSSIQDKWTFDITPSRFKQIVRKGSDLPYELKVKALAKSSNKHNADMIIAATFDYEQNIVVDGIMNKVSSNVITIVVSGYPAKFTNWSSVSKDKGDYVWINDFYGQKFGWDKRDKEKKNPSNINVTINSEKK